MNLETKFCRSGLSGLQVKRGTAASSSSGVASLSGYGAIFGNVDSYGDVIQKGAFSDAVKNARAGRFPAMLLQHMGFLSSATDMCPCGVWTSLAEDDYGLRLSGQLADTTIGRDLSTLLTMSPRPALDGLSIGYKPISFIDKPDSRVPAGASRLLTKIALYEVSFVTFPANDRALIDGTASASMDSRVLDVAKQLERTLRQATHASMTPGDVISAELCRMQRLLEEI